MLVLAKIVAMARDEAILWDFGLLGVLLGLCALRGLLGLCGFLKASFLAEGVWVSSEILLKRGATLSLSLSLSRFGYRSIDDTN